jgi:integrase
MSNASKGSPPGLRRVKKALSDGSVAIYLYAWRGRNAPRLYETEGSEALWREWRRALATWGRDIHGGDVAAWLERWRTSAEFARLKPNTQAVYEFYIARIRDRFGKADPLAFTEPAMRPLVIDWRDSMAEAPAMADKTLDGLRAFLAWLQDRGVIGAHVCANIARIARTDRSECVWSDAQMGAFRASAPAQLVRVMDVARLTAFGCSELCRLEWTMVEHDAIEIRRSKTGALAVVPVVPELRAVLAAIQRAHSRVLVNGKGEPWKPKTLTQKFSTATLNAGIPERTLHDLRRTAATEFCKAGFDDREVAAIMGWDSAKVAQIRRRYVDQKEIIRRGIARLSDYRLATGGNAAKGAA